MSERAYFDWNATTPLREEARAAMVEALGHTGNASSMHEEGRAARRRVEEARDQVAALVGAEAKDVTFTAGATEANMLALTPALETANEKAPRDRLFVSAVEHPSVRCGGRFAPDQVTELTVDADGVVDLAALEKALTQAERPLVSVMLANNETGVIQPISEIAEIVHAANGLLHVDAVQAPGRIACDIVALGADLHEPFRPQARRAAGGGRADPPKYRIWRHPHCRSADQGRRPGALPACRHRERGGHRRLRRRRCGCAGRGAGGRFPHGRFARPPGSRHQGRHPGSGDFRRGSSARLPNTTLFAVPGLKAETAIIAFDLNGIALSSGSACSSGKVQPSHVLAAMGVAPDLARGALRVSLGWTTTEAAGGTVPGNLEYACGIIS